MSIFSGKSDFSQTVRFNSMSKLYPDKENSPLISNEMESFDIFKKETGGKIYQHFKLELTEYNIEQEIKAVNNPDHLSRKEIPWDDDKNHKTKKYVYTYFWKEYKSLKELNKKKYYALREIRFETLLDLIPYFPHLVSAIHWQEGKRVVIISSDSFVDRQEFDARKYGYDNSSLLDIYRRNLRDYYVEMVNKFYSQPAAHQTKKSHFKLLLTKQDLLHDLKTYQTYHKGNTIQLEYEEHCFEFTAEGEALTSVKLINKKFDAALPYPDSFNNPVYFYPDLSEGRTISSLEELKDWADDILEEHKVRTQ